MTSHTKRSLFGGALLAAGLMAPAQAQNLIIGYANAQTYAFDYFYGNGDLDSWVSSGPFTLSSSSVNNYASAYGKVEANNLHIRTEASAGGFGGFAYGYDRFNYFNVDQDLTANVNWDFTGGFGRVNIYDLTLNTNILSNGGSATGSTPLNLLQSHLYYIEGLSGASLGHGDNISYWEMSVPAPGAAGLLGVAGLVAARRRR